MDSDEGVSLPMFHEHPMMPCNYMREGDCCGHFETNSDGYYCRSCDVFIHRKCVEDPEYIQHPSHPVHFLRRLREGGRHRCDLCANVISNLRYRCEICNFSIHLYCAKYPPPEVIDTSETHHHKLTLLKDFDLFDCDMKCGGVGLGFCYKCHECNLTSHMRCVMDPPPPQSLLDLRTLEFKPPLEVNHSYHSLHPLKVLKGQPPNYSDGKCRLCERKIDDNWFYHCSSCNFSLDVGCVLYPPPQSLLDLKTHEHQLTLLSRLDSFTCNACGLKGDRSPYICVQCGFFVHQNCVGLPRVININRHDHRISRVSLIGVVNSVCGVCRKKVDWTCGGYSCNRCPAYVVHSKCATREDVWNGEELEEVPEEKEDIEPYVVIDANTIQHFSHEEHHLRHNVSLLWEDNKWCNACTHPITLHSFYSCIDCEFFLHENCAQLPKKKRHVLYNDQLTLVTNKVNGFRCEACNKWSNGFTYRHVDIELDVRCSSIYEPFVHPSHHHPLYYVLENEDGYCKGCGDYQLHVLTCIEDDCEFVLGFECATLPQVVKHRVDDHPLSLCYGEKASGGTNWCDICEQEINPETWFYTCKDHRACLHTKCVLGVLLGFLPKSTIKVVESSYEVVLNSSVTRPFCRQCKSRCIYPIILKMLGTSDTYICSYHCSVWFS